MLKFASPTTSMEGFPYRARNPLRSSMKRKSTLSLISRQSYAGSSTSEFSLQRRTHFDQNNIALTYKPLKKDYGYIQIKQASTPFPRRSSLPHYTGKRTPAMREEMKNSIDSALPRDFSDSSLSDEMDFATKRKIFCTGEFTITRQRKSLQVHPPMRDIKSITEGRLGSSYANLPKFFRKHYHQRSSSIVLTPTDATSA
ncbi:uncharacterized protein LOC110118459 [Ceratitis capitata]|uniref:(Mediterranean fruit fly) hypothetical protein n=1 Tax=Ceratitis capitata TaxID=7213 RepID=W8CCQ7_CERCA|nr:uncharacterized protein LOC110118459 [Ceratitis capitata]CAD6994173.1 unnamed protein product [Ceratitis capitata]